MSINVSVIIPTYNYGQFIGECIESVLAQTYKDFEIIVVDDGSSDNTKELIESKYKDKVRYFYQMNRGAPAARNKGLRESQGEYLVFLDADDWLAPESLLDKISIVKKKSDIHWVYSDSNLVDIQGKFLGKSSEIFGFDHEKMNLDPFKSFLLRGNFISTSVSLISKKCVLNINGFDESLQALQDYDLNLRLAKDYHPQFIKKPLVFQRIHSNSITSSIFKALEARISVVDKIRKDFPEESAKYRKELIKTEAGIYNYLGVFALSKSERIMAFMYFLKSIYRRPFQKRAYELVLTTMMKNDINDIMHNSNYTIWELYKK